MDSDLFEAAMLVLVWPGGAVESDDLEERAEALCGDIRPACDVAMPRRGVSVAQ